ncbi:hypothetical protein ANO11243_043130 [Dothideomycetidae sp. 11243]|nr:hypothetical protein ANO11243_043130 [fungal sp. No.11243]
MGSFISPTTLFALSAAFASVCGQTITVTEKFCPTAVHTKTTTVHSTVSVYPSGGSDSSVNGGSPFVVKISAAGPGGYMKRQAGYVEPAYLLPNGNTTIYYSKAAQYRILAGQLQLIGGSFISADYGTSVMSLTPSDYIGSITKDFSSQNGTLKWANSDFSGGYAQFYMSPMTLSDNAQILVQLDSNVQHGSDWGLVSLVPQPAPAHASASASLSPYSWTTPTSETSPTETAWETNTESTAWETSAAQTSTAQESAPSPGRTSPDGSCGGTVGYTCIGTVSGSCSPMAIVVVETITAVQGAKLNLAFVVEKVTGICICLECSHTDHPAPDSAATTTSPEPVMTMSMPMGSSTYIDESPTSTPGNVSPDGSCGGDMGYTCIGAFSGSCSRTDFAGLAMATAVQVVNQLSANVVTMVSAQIHFSTSMLELTLISALISIKLDAGNKLCISNVFANVHADVHANVLIKGSIHHFASICGHVFSHVFGSSNLANISGWLSVYTASHNIVSRKLCSGQRQQHQGSYLHRRQHNLTSADVVPDGRLRGVVGCG